MTKRTLAAAAPIAAALTLAACGGGGSSSSSSSSTGASLTAFCDKATELQQLGSTFQNLAAGDLAGAKSAFGEAEQKLKEVDAAAPSEVKSDADKVLSVFSDINSAVQGANTPQDLRTKLQPLASEVNGLQTSLANLRSYGQKNCNQ